MFHGKGAHLGLLYWQNIINNLKKQVSHIDHLSLLALSLLTTDSVSSAR